jgi:AcrR family transcriptional regulator
MTAELSLDGRRARGAATRERVLAAARALFGEEGYEATSIESVLEASGVARGALYHHFRSKSELFDAVLADVLVEIAQRTAAAAAGHGKDPVQGLRAGSHAWLALALEPEIQRIALLDPTGAVGWARWREQDQQHSLGGLRATLARLAEEGRVPQEQAELLAHVLLAALNEAALFVAFAEDQRAAAATARATVDTLIERLFAEPR